MSCVILQIGQCGNQVGEFLWNFFDELNEPGYIFHHPDGYYRSLAVDTEPKVINRLCRGRSGQCAFRNENIIVDRNGRGNNWAFGYYGGQNNDSHTSIFENIMSSTRKEIERCDNFMGTMLIHSLSGGTGSGLGSRVVELLREEYPANYVISNAVLPFTTGESPLQNYNTVLSLSVLARSADGIIVFSNDDLLRRLAKQRSQSQTQPPVISLNAINKHLATCIAGLVAPVDCLTSKSGVSIGAEPWEMLRSVCPMPSHKFVHVNSILRKSSTWEEMTSAVLRSLNRRNRAGNTFSSLANLVVARGDRDGMFHTARPHIESQINSTYSSVGWNPFPVDFWTSAKSLDKLNYTKSLTVAANYSNIVPQLEQIVESSRMKLNARAYLHWYEKYGCTFEHFQEAIETVQTVADAYNDATN